jgi:hypothetical protein
MNTRSKPQDYEFFELLKGGTYHFSTYRRPDGSLAGVNLGDNDDGKPVWKRFALEKTNKYRVHKTNKQEMKLFLEHPNNPDSPYFNGNAFFRKYQPEKQLQTQIDIELAKASAVTEAGNLKGERLFEVASLLGAFYDKEQEVEALRFVIGVATKDPAHFVKVFHTPRKESKVRRIVKAALFHSIIKLENGAYRFGQTTLGAEEDGVVARLTSDEGLLEIIEKRAGLAAKQEEAKEEAPLPPRTGAKAKAKVE